MSDFSGSALLLIAALGAVSSFLAALAVYWRSRRIPSKYEFASWTDYKQLFDGLVDEARTVVSFREDLAVHYFIDENPLRDEVYEFHNTSTVDDQALSFRTFYQDTKESGDKGVSSSGRGRSMQVEEVRLDRKQPSPVTRIKVLPLSPRPDRVRSAVAFEPPLRHGRVAWVVRYRVDDLWSKLRESLEDTAWYQLDGDYCDRLTVQIALPRGWTFENLTYPDVGTSRELEVGHGRHAMEWTCDRPQQGRFAFGLRVARPRAQQGESDGAVAS